MNTRILMQASAIFLGLLGAGLSFLPQELLVYFGEGATGITPYLMQLAGAGLLGFGITNWMAKSILIGGIYARPLAMGNFLHFVAGGLSLIKAAPALGNEAFWLVSLLYCAFAILFGWLLFSHPLKARTS